VSDAVEQTIAELKANLHDPQLAWLFENCFPNTLDTTVKYHSPLDKPDTFIITGDIDAMWLRDSTAQVWPYLPLIKTDQKLRILLAGLINRQVKCVLTDPYANAFNFDASGSEWMTDMTEMKPTLHERKWEVDSLCYVIRLSYGYWKYSNDATWFDGDWLRAMKTIVQTFKDEQRKNKRSKYSFRRKTELAQDTAQGDGTGNPVRPVGLICSVFRPSDDATIFPFLVPSNYFAVQALGQLCEVVQALGLDPAFVTEIQQLTDEVNQALKQHAICNHNQFGQVFAYEIDGYGSRLFMDDANVPGLLSLPYLGAIDVHDPIYQNTRRLVLSDFNPYYIQGTFSGIGGPHSGRDMIWPLGLILQALTSLDDKETAKCIDTLKKTHANTGFMHESFHKDRPDKYTRSWFAWANTLFGELILKLYKEHKV
jgi:meiotically up-regulated gene 157 (Mug157) protein